MTSITPEHSPSVWETVKEAVRGSHQDYTEVPIGRAVVLLAVPMVLEMLMESVGASMAPDAVVVPMLSTGATDGAALREAGIPTYGILPMPLEQEDELRMHADNERVPLASLGWATEYLYRVLATVAMR